MSSIGKNIRKIRTIKGLSQSAFANLFNLTRASISAYEEGRAEPKMDTTLDIAKHFSIPIENLLSHEITVNEFARFNIQNFIGTDRQQKTNSIPFISSWNWDSFIKAEDTSDVPRVDFPLGFLQGEIAIELNEKINSQFHSGTILLCKKEEIASKDNVYLYIDDQGSFVKNGLYNGSSKSPKIYRVLQSIQEINSISSNTLEERVSELELKINKLLKSK